MDFKEITTYGNDVEHVSICKKLKCQLYPYMKFFEGYDGDIYTLEFYERIGLSVDVLVKMLLFDALLESQDRHWGNWGNWGICKKHGKRSIAPIFDNGAGLLPRENLQKLM